MTAILNEIRKLKLKYAYKRARELIESTDVKSPDLLRALAECYYKDLELHRDDSYEKALYFLNEIVDDNNKKKLCVYVEQFTRENGNINKI